MAVAILFKTFFVLTAVAGTSAVTIGVTVYTGDLFHAGTNAGVFMTLSGKRGTTYEHKLTNSENNHERNDVDQYTLSVYEVGTPTSLWIRHDNSGAGAGWYLSKIIVTKSSKSYTFDCNQWLNDDVGTGRRLYPKKCTYLPTAPSNGVWETEPAPYIVHQTAVLQCNAGYVRSTIYDSLASVTCYSSGSWSITRVICCPEIDNCESGSQVCSSTENTCTSCVDDVLYRPMNNSQTCEPLCSYNSHYCWPGHCTDDIRSGCTCANDFKLVSNTNTTSCQLTKVPSIETCHTVVVGQTGQEKATESTDSTQCVDLENIHGNFQPTTVRSELFVELSVNISSLAVPTFINDSPLGVTDVLVTLTKKDINANNVNSTTNHILRDTTSGTQVQESFSNTTLTIVPNDGFILSNGERLCILYETKGGGYLKSQTPTGTISPAIPYKKTSASQEICYIYDDILPQHCLQPDACSTEPLYVSQRVTRSTTIPVQFRDWVDPIPVDGDESGASGIDAYHITVYAVEATNIPLRVGTTAILSNTFSYNSSSATLTLPTTSPKLFCLVLNVEDKAGNNRHARRFVLIDDTSLIEIDRSKDAIVYSASPATQYSWQTNHDPICLTWKKFFYNKVYRDNYFLEQIEEDPNGLINGSYDQINGTLPITGTNHIDGIVKFEISWGINNVHQVANLTSQTACIDADMEDGATYNLTVKASDIANNVRAESRTVHIDRSEPDINNFRLESDTTHLSEIELLFEVNDTHSGIKAITWSVETAIVSSEMSGSVSVQRIGRSKCSADDNNCYCPAIGACEVLRYVLPLRRMAPEWTHIRIHNQTCIVTLIVTNHAMLSHTENIEFRVEHTPVEGTEQQTGLGLYVGIPAAVVVVCLIAVVLFFIVRRRKQRQNADNSSTKGKTCQDADDSSRIYDVIPDDRRSRDKQTELEKGSENYNTKYKTDEKPHDQSSGDKETDIERGSENYEKLNIDYEKPYSTPIKETEFDKGSVESYEKQYSTYEKPDSKV